jgi:hypothetical protein
MKKYENYGTSILDITFYLLDENGNEIENKDGTTKEFKLKDGVRFKPLEYLCEDLDTDMLEEKETNVQSDTKEQIQREKDRSKRSSKSDV